MPNESKKNNTVLIIIIIVIAILFLIILPMILLGGCGYLLYKTSNEATSIPALEQTLSPTPTNNQTTSTTNNWQSFSVGGYGISFLLPSNWNIIEQEENVTIYSDNNMNLDWRSGEMTNFGLEDCTQTNQSNIQILGKTEIKYDVDCGTQKLIYTKFNYNGIDHLGLLSFSANENDKAQELFTKIIDSIKTK